MMKKPGLSTARVKPFKLGPLAKVASVNEARSLTSPALKANAAAAAGALLFSVSYLPFKEAFILGEETERDSKRRNKR